MAELTASQKYACPACGAEAQWNPAKSALVCPFCGTTSPAIYARSRAGLFKKTNWRQRFESIDDSRARAGKPKRSRSNAGVARRFLSFDPARVSQRCDFCGSSALVPYEQTRAPIRPESLLEFKVAETKVREDIRQWYGSRFWAPRKLKSTALTDTVKGVYLPYWTFDAQVHADWQAQAGYYYYVTEILHRLGGQIRKRDRCNTRAGSRRPVRSTTFSMTRLCPHPKVSTPICCANIEPFPTTSDLKPYDPAFLSGWIVEQYQIDLITAAGLAQMDDDK